MQTDYVPDVKRAGKGGGMCYAANETESLTKNFYRPDPPCGTRTRTPPFPCSIMNHNILVYHSIYGRIQYIVHFNDRIFSFSFIFNDLLLPNEQCSLFYDLTYTCSNFKNVVYPVFARSTVWKRGKGGGRLTLTVKYLLGQPTTPFTCVQYNSAPYPLVICRRE